MVGGGVYVEKQQVLECIYSEYKRYLIYGGTYGGNFKVVPTVYSILYVK